MVSTLFKSTLREIRQSLGRFLAILAIVGLGVGFFAGLRMAQPSMIATGASYMEQHSFHDFRLLSTLGFTEEDVEAFSRLEGIETAQGSVYTQFLWTQPSGKDLVLSAHMLTAGINEPNLIAGRMPSAPNECLGDPLLFTENQLGSSIRVSEHNKEETSDLFVFDEYTLVGLADSPLYLNYERGTAAIGSGSVSAFLFIPEGGFDFDACYEIFLRIENGAEAYTDAYQTQIDSIKPTVEVLLDERAALRYDTLYADAMDEIHDGEKELTDGWEEYRTEKADAEQELADAHQKLLDGEKEYADGLADYEQGKLDYADGLKQYEDGLAELEDARVQLEDARTELADGKAKLEKGKAELADAKVKYEDGLAELEKGKADYESGKADLEDAKAELEKGKWELTLAWLQLEAARKQLEEASAQLNAGEASYAQLNQLYQSASALAQVFHMDSPAQLIAALNSGAAPDLNAAVDQALQSGGSSLAQFLGSWAMTESAIGQPLDSNYLTALRASLDSSRAEYETGMAAYQSGMANYENGWAEIDWAEAEIIEGEGELADALVEIQSGEQELADALAEIEKGEQKLADAEAEILKGEQELAEAEAEILKGEQELADAEAEILKGEQDLIDAEAEILKGEQELADAEVEYEDGLADLAEAKLELDDAKAELEQAPTDLADARAELDDGWKEYQEGSAEAEAEFADAEKELHEGEEEIADAYEKLSELKRPDTFTLTRHENTGYAAFDNDTAIIAAISLVFPLFFFLVAALVCMTTMKRMVDEQRTQIGVLKAIGYSRQQIIGKYLFYSGSAAFTGSVLGYLLGSWGLPAVIWVIYGIMYGFAPLQFQFDPVLAAVSLAAALLCSMGATWLSCRMELSRQAAELIRPKAPKAGKRVFLEYITPIWKRLGFLRKVSIRNVLRYRSRLIMMVLGIGGCTALLVAGFGVRDSIAFLPDDQFEEITLFDYSVNFQDPLTQEEADRFLADSGWDSKDALLVHSGSTDILSTEGSRSVYLIVPANDSLDGFISLHSGEIPIPFPKPGEVVINYALSRDLAIGVGDVVTLRHDEMGSIEATVSAICDNFIFNYVFLSPETYRQQLGIAPELKTLLVMSRPGADPYAESVLLAEGDHVSNVSVNQASRDQLTSMLSRLNILVVVVVLCAAALAFIVLYNLTNINITERIREIATIKVLGFYQNETATYVFREINMLSAIGSLVGLPLGRALHAFIIAQIKVDGMFFPSRVDFSSYLFSLALTMLFTWLITHSMRPRLKKIDMAESLKSIE